MSHDEEYIAADHTLAEIMEKFPCPTLTETFEKLPMSHTHREQGKNSHVSHSQRPGEKFPCLTLTETGEKFPCLTLTRHVDVASMSAHDTTSLK